jgi:hypothetical protein
MRSRVSRFTLLAVALPWIVGCPEADPKPAAQSAGPQTSASASSGVAKASASALASAASGAPGSASAPPAASGSAAPEAGAQASDAETLTPRGFAPPEKPSAPPKVGEWSEAEKLAVRNADKLGCEVKFAAPGVEGAGRCAGVRWSGASKC